MVDQLSDQLRGADWNHIPPQLEGLFWFLGLTLAGLALLLLVKLVFAAARWDRSRTAKRTAEERLENIETTLIDAVQRLKSVEERVDKLQKADEAMWGKR